MRLVPMSICCVMIAFAVPAWADANGEDTHDQMMSDATAASNDMSDEMTPAEPLVGPRTGATTSSFEAWAGPTRAARHEAIVEQGFEEPCKCAK